MCLRVYIVCGYAHPCRDMPYKNPLDLKIARKRWKKSRLLRNKEKKRVWISENGPCVKCGSWNQIEIDHIVPVGRRNYDNVDIFGWAPERLKKELQNCQCLCNACHCKKSADEKRGVRRNPNHGLNSYARHGCRCEVCRAAMVANKRKQRKRQAVRAAFQKITQNFPETFLLDNRLDTVLVASSEIPASHIPK